MLQSNWYEFCGMGAPLNNYVFLQMNLSEYTSKRIVYCSVLHCTYMKIHTQIYCEVHQVPNQSVCMTHEPSFVL